MAVAPQLRFAQVLARDLPIGVEDETWLSKNYLLSEPSTT